MISIRGLLTLLGIIGLQSFTGTANFLDASDELTCFNLCTNCNGTPIFKNNNVCECYVADDNKRGVECIDRIKRQAEELGLGVVSCDLADADADRAARCILKPLLGRAKSKNDVDLVAKYFMGDGSKGGLGSLLGSFKPPNDLEDTKSPSTSQDSTSPSGSENVGASLTADGVARQADGGGAASDSLSLLDRAGDLPGDLLDLKPFLGAAAAWLQPSNLVAIGNGLQGIAPSAALIGQQYSPNFGRANTVNDDYQRNTMPQADIVSSPMRGLYDQQTAFRAGNNFGMLPYGYYVGAPNQIQNQLQAGSQVYPMQNYVDNYNAMVAAPNPSFSEPNYMGAIPYYNYPTFGGLPNGFEASNAAPSQIVGEPNPIASSEPRKSYPELEENQVEKVGDSKKLEVNPEEVKDQSPKLRKSRFKSKDSYAKVEKMYEKKKE